MTKISEALEDRFNTLKNTDKRGIAKVITRAVVRHSVSGVIVTLTHNYCPTFDKKQQLQLYVGAWALGGVVSDSASDWAAKKMDDYIDIGKLVVESLKDDPSDAKETWDKATNE